jgi:hypothetical protein
MQKTADNILEYYSHNQAEPSYCLCGDPVKDYRKGTGQAYCRKCDKIIESLGV